MPSKLKTGTEDSSTFTLLLKVLSSVHLIPVFETVNNQFSLIVRALSPYRIPFNLIILPFLTNTGRDLRWRDEYFTPFTIKEVKTPSALLITFWPFTTS